MVQTIPMAAVEAEICLLSVQESAAWIFHAKPPSRCDKGIHQHVSRGEARKMCSTGWVTLSRLLSRL